MKQFAICFCLIVSLLSATNSEAQKKSSKPFLFKNYPEVIDCTEAQLNSLFAGKDVAVNLSLGKLTLEGDIINRSTKYNSLQTVAVKLPSFGNILFSVTKRDDEGRQPIYTAHLFNPKYADGYELKRNAGNSYQLIKIETAKLLSCNM